MIDSSTYEDQLNILLDRLSKIISTFGTLSREQAEIAIIDTTSKIKEGQSIIEKLKQELENDTKNRSPEELHEEKQKIKNYEIEFNEIVNKFKIIQFLLYLLLLLLKSKKVSSLIFGILFTPLILPILFPKTFCSLFFPLSFSFLLFWSG